jgi:hypothetical protein
LRFFDIEAAADFFDAFDIRHAAGGAKKTLQIRLLGSGRQPAISLS